MNLTPYCWWVSYKRHELLTLCDYPVFTAGFDGVHVAHLFIFCDVLYCAFLYRLFITVFGFTRTGTELTIYHNTLEGEHANHFTTIAVSWN
jgi:hypothetical protein